ncbi:hypothetical protein Tco_0610449 [Tanacetum coccineum]
MAESSSQNPSSPNLTPKEEHVTLEKPNSLNLFLPADQVEFTFDEMLFTTNNEVARIHPYHPNSAEIRVKGTLKKSCLPPRWRLLMGQIIQCLGGKTGGLDQISNKDATILYCLAIGINVDFARIIWEDLIHKLKKKSRERVITYPRFISLLLEYMAPEYANEICNLAALNVPKAPKPSSIAERVPQGTKPGAKLGHKKQSTSSKQPSVSSREATKDTEMHKEDQQAAGGLSSLGATTSFILHSESASGHDASANFTTEADPGISAPKDSISYQQGMDEGTKNYSFAHILVGSNPSVLVDKTKSAKDGLKTAHTTLGANEESRADDISQKVKLEDFSDILKDTRSAFFTPDSPTDEPIIVSDESEEEEDAEKDKDTKDTSVPPLPSPKLAQIQELMAQLTELLVTSLKPELSKLLASHDFANCLPTELKELPSKITKISGEIKELKHHVRDMEIELHADLLEIPTKLETFTSTISIQEKLQTLDSLPSLLHKVTNTLNRFSTMVDNALGATSMHVSPAEGDKNTKDAGTNLKDEQINLLGKDVVTNEDRLRKWETILSENVIRLLGNKDPPNACLVYMICCLANQKRFNLAYYIAKRMAGVIKSDFMVLPCAMLLTRLYRHVLTNQPYPTTNMHYLVDHIMVPLTEGRAHRIMVDGKRPHPQTSLGSLSSQSPTLTQREVDPMDNYTLDLVVYCDQLLPILGEGSPEFKQTKGMFKCLGHFLSNLRKKK